MTPRRDTHVGPKLRARSLKRDRGVVAVTTACESLGIDGFREEEGLPTPLYSGLGNPLPPKTPSSKDAFRSLIKADVCSRGPNVPQQSATIQ